jgi:hypothetical protein
MIAENVNTHAHGDVHLVVLAHLRRRWILRGREGFGVLSPSRRVCSAGFGAFMEIKRLFSFAPEARKRGEVRECFSRNTRRTLVAAASNAGPASDVVSVEARVDVVVIGASDAITSDAGQTLCNIQWLHDVSNFFEPSCAPDTVASIDPPSDASGERKSSLDPYWTASDAERRRRTCPVAAGSTVDF